MGKKGVVIGCLFLIVLFAYITEIRPMMEEFEIIDDNCWSVNQLSQYALNSDYPLVRRAALKELGDTNSYSIIDNCVHALRDVKAGDYYRVCGQSSCYDSSGDLFLFFDTYYYDLIKIKAVMFEAMQDGNEVNSQLAQQYYYNVDRVIKGIGINIITMNATLTVTTDAYNDTFKFLSIKELNGNDVVCIYPIIREFPPPTVYEELVGIGIWVDSCSFPTLQKDRVYIIEYEGSNIDPSNDTRFFTCNWDSIDATNFEIYFEKKG